MKQIIFMRHAKSSWSNSSLNDHSRPLNKRGIRNAPLMAQRLVEFNILPEHAYVSDSTRTRETWDLVRDIIPINFSLHADLYLPSSSNIVRFIRQSPNTYSNILIITHNPGITEVVEQLSNARIDNIPTAGICCITFDTNDFKEILNVNSSMEYFSYPKLV